ncbi:hypothetical protein [Streptomyces sp. KS 21]|uniref:hypothetical protein n=1 Tax=Streptomyces sp. KS 21 TaxID=2485150 RepID=UPI0010633217|nr:hypothetical protein [Streptomyces sp. KS 21]
MPPRTAYGCPWRALARTDSSMVSGPAMAVRLPEFLGLTLRERNSMPLSAGYAPSYADSPAGSAAIGPAIEALLQAPAA